MSNYSKTTDFEAKDSLPTGDSGKIIRGAEFETEFDAISTAIATKADTAGPTFTGTLTFETISDGTIGVTAFVDEDDMVSNSATLVPTQQSVKAYVDSQVTAQDLDFQADTGGALSIDLDSESLTFTGGTGIDTSGALNTVTFAIDSTVATLTGTQTLTNKTLTSPDVNTPDIDGGTIDGATIATSDITVGLGKTLDVSGGTLTLANDQISGDKVEGGTIASTTITSLASTTVDTTNLEVTNIKAKDGTSAGSIADLTGVVTLASSVLTTTDINGGTIDGATIGATTPAAVSATTVSATGNITVGGTVDGRDIATDGTKLDTVETNADVTDTANVTAAGALMDSELTSEASVKALNQGVATTDSPTFAGLTTTGSVSFGDNDKAIFGADSDLQIYHDGSNSYITDSGTGNLNILANEFALYEGNGTDLMIGATPNGAVTLSHNASTKLATTSTGIDVTGTVEFDGLSGTGSVSVTDILDQDDMSSNSATALATQQSIKAYVDSQVGANNELSEVLGNGNTTGGTDLSVSSGDDITFADSSKAIFGAGSDLQIYHDGSNSYIDDSGTGLLRLRSNQIYLEKYTGEIMAALTADAGVNLRYDNEIRLETTSTGIDVTGSVTADGLNLDGNIQGDTGQNMQVSAGAGTGDKLDLRAGDDVRIYVDGATAHKLSANFANNGDISFYEDTGTTAKLFWDASAESLGIGTTSPDALLEVNKGSEGEYLRVGGDNASNARSLRFASSASSGGSVGALHTITANSTAGEIAFANGDGTIMYLKDGGNVGIGTDDPSTKLEITGTADAETGLTTTHTRSGVGYTLILDNLTNATNNGSGIKWRSGGFDTGAIITRSDATAASSDAPAFMTFHTSADGTENLAERMRIDSSGNLLVGTTSYNSDNVGFGVRGSDGLTYATRSGGASLILNRTTSDGAIVDFRKDGTTVGSINATNGDLAIGTGNTKLRFDDASDAIHAGGGDGSGTNAGTDLGTDTYKFGDLYLSGGVVFGATGGSVTSKTLDDYEEGTWTPTAQGSTTAGVATYTTQSGRYTKVGRLVTLQFSVIISGWTTDPAGFFRIGGLPFTIGGDVALGSFMASSFNFDNGGSDSITASLYAPSNLSQLRLYITRDDVSWTQQGIDPEAFSFLASITYSV